MDKIPDKTLDGSLVIRMSGELKAPIPRPNAPNFNKELLTGSEIGLPNYEIAHLWGPGFGDEAWDGMMYAPREVNQVFQNEKMEARLRELQKLADREGAIIRLTAEAESYLRKVGKGHELLKRVSYRFEVRYPHGSTGVIGDVDISVPAPGSPDQIGVDAKPGSAGPWSLL